MVATIKTLKISVADPSKFTDSASRRRLWSFFGSVSAQKMPSFITMKLNIPNFPSRFQLQERKISKQHNAAINTSMLR